VQTSPASSCCCPRQRCGLAACSAPVSSSKCHTQGQRGSRCDRPPPHTACCCCAPKRLCALLNPTTPSMWSPCYHWPPACRGPGQARPWWRSPPWSSLCCSPLHQHSGSLRQQQHGPQGQRHGRCASSARRLHAWLLCSSVLRRRPHEQSSSVSMRSSRSVRQRCGGSRRRLLMWHVGHHRRQAAPFGCLPLWWVMYWHCGSCLRL
jgi:hypothetical protein